MKRSYSFLLFVLVVFAGQSLTAAGAQAPVNREARQVMLDAKARAVEVPKQATALTELAWPNDGNPDPAVQQFAREEIVNFGKSGLNALRTRLKMVGPLYQADIATAIIEAQRQARAGTPPDYLPAIEEAIWFGSSEAQRIGMLEIVNHTFPTAVLSTIDAITAHPELTVPGLRALGRMGDPRARFFLRRVLLAGEPRYKYEAARSLGMMGDEGLNVIKHAAHAEAQKVREAAMGEFLKFATPDDLTMLYEYVANHESDDPALLARLMGRSEVLEAELEQIQFSESASADPPIEEPAADEQP